MSDPDRPVPAVLRADDPIEAALVLADELGADLVDGADRLPEVLAGVRTAVAEREEARSVLALLPAPAPAGPLRVVSDLAELRLLVPAIAAARLVVEEATAAARRHAEAALGTRRLALGLEAAARELLLARAESEARSDELAHQEAEWTEEQRRRSETPRRGGAHLVDDPDDLVVGRRPRAFDRFADVVGRRSSRSDDDDLASDALAHVSALTERAYGGAASALDGEVPEAIAALRADTGTDDRLRRAEETWTVLAGDADPDGDLPEVPVAELPDGVEEAAPAVRAAAADLRRLEARWKVAWWALDQPVPPHDAAEEALDRLESDGTFEITVEGWSPRSAAAVDRTRFEAAADGRSEEQLRAVAERAPAPVVVLDEHGAADVEAFEAEVAILPDDAGVTLVVPA